MPVFSISNVKFSGIAACVPTNSESNRMYDWISEKERETLISTTGIENRRIVTTKACISDLCVPAASKLISDLNWNPSEIGALILVSQSTDYVVPATALIMQEKLGLSTSCLAFDVNLGCSGYVYGLSILSGLLSAGQIDKGLLLVGDISSRGISRKDKSAWPLFSDAAAVTALQYDRDSSPMHFNLQSDGSGADAIIIPDGGLRNFITPESLIVEEIEPGIVRNRRQIALNGIDIFNFTLREVKPNVEALLSHQRVNTKDVDAFVFHQANMLINKMVAKKLKLEAHQVPYSLKDFGNTSSATIPITMVTQLKDTLRNNVQTLVLSGFGVGLSWGSVLLKTDNIVCSDLIEIDI